LSSAAASSPTSSSGKLGARQFGQRADHARRGPQADQPRQAGEQDHGHRQRRQQLEFVQRRAGDVVAHVADQVGVAPDRVLVAVQHALRVDGLDVVHARVQALQFHRHLVGVARAPGARVEQREEDRPVGILARLAHQVVDFLLQRVLDQLPFQPVAQRHAGHREQRGQPEAEQQVGQDEAAAQPLLDPHG